MWKPGAEAIIFTAPDVRTAQKLKQNIGNNTKNWRKIVDGFSGQVQADSGRFELKQLPGSSATLGAGKMTPIKTNADKSVQFAYIIRMYTSSSPRTFEEARGLVINDYQNELENVWIAELKKKYPVSVNQAVFNSLALA